MFGGSQIDPEEHVSFSSSGTQIMGELAFPPPIDVPFEVERGDSEPMLSVPACASGPAVPETEVVEETAPKPAELR